MLIVGEVLETSRPRVSRRWHKLHLPADDGDRAMTGIAHGANGECITIHIGIVGCELAVRHRHGAVFIGREHIVHRHGRIIHRLHRNHRLHVR